MTTLSLEAELPWQVTYMSGLRVSPEPVDGPIPSGVLHKRAPRTWTLQLQTATDEVRQALDVAHDATRGGAQVMDWTPPGEVSAVSVRFLPGLAGYRRARVSVKRWQIQVALQEALST